MKNAKVRIVVASLAAAACLFNVGCERHSASEQYYLIAANIGLSYWKAANEGLQAAAVLYGVKAEMRGPNSLDAKAEADEVMAAADKEIAAVADEEILRASRMATELALALPELERRGIGPRKDASRNR